MIPKIDPSPAFTCTKSLKFMTSGKTYLPSINTLACSKAEI